MKHLLYSLAIVLLISATVACDQVVLPGSGTDDPVDVTPPKDTNRFVVISGPVVNRDGIRVAAPEGAVVFVVWETGRQNDVVFGQGTLNPARTEYRIELSGRLPELALFDPDGSAGIHGMGTIVLAPQRLIDRTLIAPIRNGLEFPGRVLGMAVIYNTGQEKATVWTSPWLEAFNVGWTAAIPDGGGWIPATTTNFPMTLKPR